MPNFVIWEVFYLFNSRLMDFAIYINAMMCLSHMFLSNDFSALAATFVHHWHIVHLTHFQILITNFSWNDVHFSLQLLKAFVTHVSDDACWGQTHLHWPIYSICSWFSMRISIFRNLWLKLYSNLFMKGYNPKVLQ